MVRIDENRQVLKCKKKGPLTLQALKIKKAAKVAVKGSCLKSK